MFVTCTSLVIWLGTHATISRTAKKLGGMYCVCRKNCVIWNLPGLFTQHLELWINCGTNYWMVTPIEIFCLVLFLVRFSSWFVTTKQILKINDIRGKQKIGWKWNQLVVIFRKLHPCLYYYKSMININHIVKS